MKWNAQLYKTNSAKMKEKASSMEQPLAGDDASKTRGWSLLIKVGSQPIYSVQVHPQSLHSITQKINAINLQNCTRPLCLPLNFPVKGSLYLSNLSISLHMKTYQYLYRDIHSF